MLSKKPKKGLGEKGGGAGTFGLFEWGCAARTLETLAYTRASLSEFYYPILDWTPQIPSYPRVAVFQKQLRSLAQSSQNKTDLIFLYSWVAIPSFPSLD